MKVVMSKHHFLKDKKVLFFSTLQIQSPQSGGQWRTFSLIKEAKELGAEVSIFSLTGRREDYLSGKKSSAISKSEYDEWVHRGKIAAFLQWISYRFKLPPIWVSLYLLITTPKKLRTLLEKADILVLDFPYGLPLFKGFSGFKVFSSHNVESLLWKNRILKLFVSSIERKVVKDSDLVLHCSFKDKEFLSSDLKKRFVYRSNRVPKNRFVIKESKALIREKLKLPSDTKLILFSGSKYEPNKEAVSYLSIACEENAAWLEKNNIKFLVVGTVSHAFREKHVLATGPVPTIEPYFAAVDAAINPVLTGSGSNVKLYEYKAAGLPILSTEFGVRGTAWQAPRDYRVLCREKFIESLEAFINRE